MIEYDCWMQSGLTTIPEFLASAAVYAHEPDYEFAAEELRRGLSRFKNYEKENPKYKIIIGAIDLVNFVFESGIKAQKPEGFSIAVHENETFIAGQDVQGTLYGVYQFLELLGLEKITLGFEYSDAPAAGLRVINHWDNVTGDVERGYAGRSLFFNENRIEYDPSRIEQYARLMASIGINAISINGVNVRGIAQHFITEEYLPDLAKLADIFRPFGIRLLISVSFAAPYTIGGLGTADPLDPAVAEWWKARCNAVYRFIPDMAGFVVKADSEHEPGPFEYGRTHADGANMLATVLKPYGGLLYWRCFVYNCVQDWRDKSVDRARAAYDHFKPLDGTFTDNVILQIKHGPYDFQVSEPVSPLFGALENTRYAMELQITQEYTGQQIDLCFLPWMWEKVMHFDTGYGTIREMAGRQLDGFAAVTNVGLDTNWTGHTLAQANLYGYGKIAWNPGLSAEKIAHEWAVLTFGTGTAPEIAQMLMDSYPIYRDYNAPFGVCFMVNPHYHYGPNPEGYEFDRWGTYHRADRRAIGIDRTPSGTGYTEQYAPALAQHFADPAACPEDLLLFFHRLPYEFVMKNGRTLVQNIYDTHFAGAAAVQDLLDRWIALKDHLEKPVFESVKNRLERQLKNAEQWRDVINTYFYRKTGVADMQGRIIY
ncbi:xylan alpha-(1-_2)-glucuronosidase [Spirochaetia bacterium]|nr:xylan alpha-(1->2)-glucuronosidase [Spirochaetia bacterium]